MTRIINHSLSELRNDYKNWQSLWREGYDIPCFREWIENNLNYEELEKYKVLYAELMDKFHIAEDRMTQMEILLYALEPDWEKSNLFRDTPMMTEEEADAIFGTDEIPGEQNEPSKSNWYGED